MRHEIIAKKLQRIGELLTELQSLFTESFDKFKEDFRIIRAAERDFQLIIDLASDINTEIILERGGRTPDTCKDSFSGLRKLGILESRASEKLVEAAKIRNILVHEYDFEEDYEKFYNSTKEMIPFFQKYIKDIYKFLESSASSSKANKGFTLIEMLVVVAVIGILSSVLLTALGPAREKARDSRIVQEVNQAGTLAASLDDGDYDALESLPSVVINNPDLKALADDITVQGGKLNIIKSSETRARAFSAYSRLNVKIGVAPDLQTQYFCVDSSGRRGFTTQEPIESRCPF